ncbi:MULTISPECIES: bifunctional glutamate--cysteine ligase GshA/glutathione synthetase GshB [unclassified Clostridium]|uniref:bifunctional glutamate--cysteine ligase GshA/glutathione synthetase GshB n=1 Tax=unclassified Clostridium TaxID=2614128 RepID=UPI00207A6F8D|nr:MULTISPECIES: bifunctional glutamate--cysteine ligase GshA/glutathione synthetase GshB [unclassified Clostridium]
MLENFKQLFKNSELLQGSVGIEREGLRVNRDGILSLKNHPKVFGDKMLNPYITTDFSESQIELITPAFSTCEETYNFLNNLYDIVALEIRDEYIWPQSMPCIIMDDKVIPIATFNKSPEGEKSRKYRENLIKKYGGKKQLISGVHYNFSFNEDMIKKLYDNANTELNYRRFKDNIYLKVTRNYLRYRWLLLYLLGGTGIVHESYTGECVKTLQEISQGAFSNDGAMSYRNSECGYKNKVELFPNYTSVNNYVKSINGFIKNGLIESHKELYSSIRLKAKDNYNLFNSLLDKGINYLEYRSIDINPFDKCGISLDDLHFLEIFNLFLLISEEESYDNWQEEAYYNQKIIARYGQNNVELKKNGEVIYKEKWALDILNQIQEINKELSLGKDSLIDTMIDKVKDNRLTYTYRIINKVKEEGYIDAHINLAKKYKENAYKNRFKLVGYEDLELSTQILMKESIKRGIETKIIDKSENFIVLKKGDKVEYVKQATKTSKDNYVSVLMMENKVVTKNVLNEAGIRVPMGMEFNSLESAIDKVDEFINMPIVVKPKSTNFGIGISIFPNGGSKDDIIRALNIGFKNDNTVLIEEFIQGKEYRFLVIGDKVAGILHRVPANVMGDGVKNIVELVKDKNLNPLRGKGYRTPLEKIEIDENVELFLKQSNIDINYIPNKDEVVYLRENSNISTGGDSVDYTDDIPERFKNIAVESSKAIGANICGVDMIIKDYRDETSDYGIIELNFNPAIHIHSYPYVGKERKIANEILKLLDLI